MPSFNALGRRLGVLKWSSKYNLMWRLPEVDEGVGSITGLNAP